MNLIIRSFSRSTGVANGNNIFVKFDQSTDIQIIFHIYLFG